MRFTFFRISKCYKNMVKSKHKKKYIYKYEKNKNRQVVQQRLDKRPRLARLRGQINQSSKGPHKKQIKGTGTKHFKETLS